MMDKAYCEKCQMEVDDLEKHNQEVHANDNEPSEWHDNDENME